MSTVSHVTVIEPRGTTPWPRGNYVQEKVPSHRHLQYGFPRTGLYPIVKIRPNEER